MGQSDFFVNRFNSIFDAVQPQQTRLPPAFIAALGTINAISFGY
jgi:hypothetical protein